MSKKYNVSMEKYYSEVERLKNPEGTEWVNPASEEAKRDYLDKLFSRTLYGQFFDTGLVNGIDIFDTFKMNDSFEKAKHKP
jgi:hypothetical protein